MSQSLTHKYQRQRGFFERLAVLSSANTSSNSEFVHREQLLVEAIEGELRVDLTKVELRP